MSKRTGLIGIKIGNSSFYDDSGKSLPVTILKIDECIVSDIKTIEKHGYSSLQLVSINGKKEIKKLKNIKNICNSTTTERGINTINIIDEIKYDKITKKTYNDILISDDKNKL
jgi:ribosomal protein L3